MNAFQKAAAKHAVAVEATKGERLLLQPQAKGAAFVAGGADPARPPTVVIGTVTRRPIVVQRVGEGSNSSDNVDLAGGRWQVGFSATLGLVIRAGDRVVRLDEPGTPTLRLAEALPIPGRILHPASEVASA